MDKFNSKNREQNILLASTLPVGDEKRKKILASLAKKSSQFKMNIRTSASVTIIRSKPMSSQFQNKENSLWDTVGYLDTEVMGVRNPRIKFGMDWDKLELKIIAVSIIVPGKTSPQLQALVESMLSPFIYRYAEQWAGDIDNIDMLVE